jgi:Flp pilus assembly protein TadG
MVIAIIRRLKQRQSGQSLTELALILPLLFILICGIIDFGRLMYTYMNVHLVTQEAVRLAGLGDSDTAINRYVTNHIAMVDPGRVNIAISPSYSARRSGDYVTVQVSGELQWVTPILSKIVPSPYRVQAKSTIRVE